MDQKSFKVLLEAGAVKRVKLLASGDRVWLEVATKTGEALLQTTSGEVRVWKSFDSALKWARRLGIGEVSVDISKWAPEQRGLMK